MNNQPTPQPTPVRLTARVRSKGADYKDWVYRAVAFVLICGSLTLAWWSVTQRLAPLQKRSREVGSVVAKLSSDVDDLDRKWTRAQAEQVSRWLDQAHDELFADETALEAWVASVRLQAAPFALLPKAEFDKPIEKTASKGEKIAIIPAALSLDFSMVPEGPERASPYLRLLRLTQRLNSYDKRADLTEMKVESGAGSINHATLLFGLWAVEGGTL
jgi:uncharacterized protein YukE